MESPRGPVVNLYSPGEAACLLPDRSEVTLTQETEYPVDGKIKITVAPSKSQRFELSLRIPSWSRQTTLFVNGKQLACNPGQYARIFRVWSAGDVVEVNLDLSGRAVPAPSGAPQFAVMRGPILLALDSRFVAPQETDVHLVVSDGSSVSLVRAKDKPDEVWMSFEVPFEVKPTHFFNHHALPLTMVDFASAGNKWSDENLFRTWLPQPLYLADAYPAHTWKIMYPNAATRPVNPFQRNEGNGA